MKVRIDDVHEAHEKTFHWLFDPAVVSFRDWLNSEGPGSTPIYWIQGHPGSGKSTLMKFAMRDERLTNILNASDNTAWTIAAFFFHDRGSEIQKSLTGMFQGLLGSILRQLPKLDSLVVPFYLDLVRAQRTRSPTWNLETLGDAVLSIVKQRNVHVRMLLFLDALDEHHGDNVLLAELLKKLVDGVDYSWVHLKLCLASRSWTTFEQYFGHCPGFAIHDHTQQDIRTYIESRVDIGTQVSRLSNDRGGLLRIVDLVAQKALGIFIWVRLVMDRISKGVRDGTPYAALEEQVKSMPLELQALYADTLRRIDPDYSTEAYIMLQVALCSLVPLPVDVFMASVELAQNAPIRQNARVHPSVESVLSMETDPPIGSMVSHKSRLSSRSGGLLELTSSAITADETLKSGDNDASLVVQFIHQTVREYFQTVPPHELGLYGVPDDKLSEDGNMFLVRSCVAQDEWITCIKRDLFFYASLAMESDQDKQAEINSLIKLALLGDGRYNLEWFLKQQEGTFYGSLVELIDEGASDLALSRVAVAKGFSEYIVVDPVDPTLVHIAAARTNLDLSLWRITDNRKAIKHLLAIGCPVDAADDWIMSHVFLDPTLAMFRGCRGLTALGVTLLVVEVSAKKRFLQAKELLESGANPNAAISADRFVLTPLQLCVCQRDADIVRLLLQHGADANVNTDGWDLLHLAFIRGDKAVIQVLLDAGLSGKPVRNLPECRTAEGLLLRLGLHSAAYAGGLSWKLACSMYHVDFDSLIRGYRE